MAAKPSHGPLIVILAVTVGVLVAVCGGSAFLLVRGVTTLPGAHSSRSTRRNAELQSPRGGLRATAT